MIEELSLVVLTQDLAERGLKAGDVGAVVEVHRQGEGFEVEFVTLCGETVDVVTVLREQVRPVGPREIPHAREVAVV